MAKILVTEIQTFDTGAVQVLNYSYDDENSALAKFHNILSVAAISKLPVHACVVYTNDGTTLRSECFKHEVNPET